jgi:hypothetical protein
MPWSVFFRPYLDQSTPGILTVLPSTARMTLASSSLYRERCSIAYRSRQVFLRSGGSGEVYGSTFAGRDESRELAMNGFDERCSRMWTSRS